MQQEKYGCLDMYKYECHYVWSISCASKQVIDSKHLSGWMSQHVYYMYFHCGICLLLFLFPFASVWEGGRGIVMKIVYHEASCRLFPWLFWSLCAYYGFQVASYEFTTLTCIPGVIVYRGAKIQVILSFMDVLVVFVQSYMLVLFNYWCTILWILLFLLKSSHLCVCCTLLRWDWVCFLPTLTPPFVFP